MKNSKKSIALFALLFNVFSVCNHVNTEPIEAKASSTVTPDYIGSSDKTKNIALSMNVFNSSFWNDKSLDTTVVNCIVTNNKSTFLSFDAAHDSSTVEEYPQEMGATKEQFIEILAFDWVTGERIMTDEEVEAMLKEDMGFEMSMTEDQRATNNSSESFYLGAYLYENSEDPEKHDLILYADADGILLGASMFSGFEHLEHIEFEGCYAVDLREMFMGCKSLTSIDLRGLNCEDWYMEKNGVKTLIQEGCSDFISMFEGCTSLVEVDFSNIPLAHGNLVKEGDWHISGAYHYRYDDFVNESDYTAMFKDCTNLQRINLSTSYMKSFNNKAINSTYDEWEINNENLLARGRYIPFGDVLFNWLNGETENKVYTHSNKQYIDIDVEHFVSQYGEMFAGCDNLTVVAFPNFISIVTEIFQKDLSTDLDIGLFINSNVESMLKCSLIGNVLISNKVSNANLEELASVYNYIRTIDTCHGNSEELDELLAIYETINSDPDYKNEVFILNNLYYVEGIHEVIDEDGKVSYTFDSELYLIRAMGKLDYMMSLEGNGDGTSQQDIITAFISDNYNAFIVIGLVSLVSVIAYYLIEKKKAINN